MAQKSTSYNGFLSGFLGLIKNLGKAFMNVFSFLKPDAMVWKGAGWGIAILVLILGLVAGAIWVSHLGIIVVSLYIVVLLTISAAGAGAINVGLYLVGRIPLF